MNTPSSGNLLLDENAALAQEIQRLADENARLLQANLQRKHAMLVSENARLQGLVSAPTEIVAAPPGLASSPPPGLEAAVDTPFDPVTAANAAMLATLTKGDASLGLLGGFPYGSTLAPSDAGSVTSSMISMQSSLASSYFGGDFDSSQPKTTLMLRNIPNSYSRQLVVDLLNKHGLELNYNLVYFPIDFNTRSGFGYAFVNFVDQHSAELCMAKLNGFRGWHVPSDKVLDATWSQAHQGFESHVERYRNSPVMHESVDDELKPAIYMNGKRIAFPPPTKKLRAPRQRR